MVDTVQRVIALDDEDDWQSKDGINEVDDWQWEIGSDEVAFLDWEAVEDVSDTGSMSYAMVEREPLDGPR